MKSVFVNDTKYELEKDLLKNWVKKVAEELLVRKILKPEQFKKSVTIVFLNKLESKRLNWQHRQKDYPTDILSFPSDDPEVFGDLVMCPEVLEEQAKKQKHPFKTEFKFMVLHGLLHLSGLTHKETGTEKTEAMLKLQEDIFNLLENKPKIKPKSKKTIKENTLSKKTASKPKAVRAKSQSKSMPKKKKTAVKAAAPVIIEPKRKANQGSLTAKLLH